MLRRQHQQLALSTPTTGRASVRCAAAAPRSSKGGIQHVVRKHEDLDFIAETYGVRREEIETLNNHNGSRLKPGTQLTIPGARNTPFLEERATSTVVSSVSMSGLQQMAAANAPGLQLAGGLLAAGVLGKMLLQWAPSLIPAPRTDSSSYNPASPQYAYAGVDSLLSDARGEIADVEKQLSSVQATRLKFAEERAAETRLRIAEQRERAAAKSLPSPSSSSSAPVAEAEASKPNVFQRMLSSASSPSSSQAGSESSVVDTDSQRLPAGFKGRGGGDKSAVEQSKSQQVERQLNEVLQESRASTSAPTQALPAFQEPEPVQLGLPGLSYELPPFAQRAELVVTSPQPSPPPVPPVPTFPLADPYAGKSLIALKSGLMDVVFGTSRGLNATARQRGAIEEHIQALEARNPHPRPTSSREMMAGHWKLVYTTNTQTLMVLNTIDALPLVDIGNVYQVIDAETMTASNKIDIAVPITQSWPLALTSEAKFEVRTPRAFKVRFTKVGVDTYVQTPQLLSALEIPESISVLGQTVDLSPLRELILNPVNAGLESAQTFIQSALNPEIGVQVSEFATAWMLTTYLDETLRISRDDQGRVFIMLKDEQLEELEDENAF